jgi:pimeloyl-ACP methyl ester carboxylesterase
MGLIAAAIAAIAAAGVIYQRLGLARDRRMFAPPGALVDVGGHRVHVACTGDGSPPVIFESGIAASSLSWAMVQPTVASFTRACTYDRAGLAWSDAPSCPRSFARIVDEFEGVVAHVTGGGRCVLVGHSFGSFVVRAYAARHPAQVAGLVLVDPPAEWLELTPQRARMLKGAQRLAALGALLAHVGVVRGSLALLAGGAPGGPRRFAKLFGPAASRTLERLVGEVRKLPREVHPMVQAHWSNPKCFRAMADYLRALAAEGATIRGLIPPPHVPVVVISAAHQPPEELRAHQQLAAAASRGVHLRALRSAHWVQFDEPEMIIGAIRDLVMAARSPG